jgi:hypothetical protein
MPLVKDKIDSQRNPVQAESIDKDDPPGPVRVTSIDRIELEPDGKHMVVHSEQSTLTFHYSVFRELLAVPESKSLPWSTRSSPQHDSFRFRRTPAAPCSNPLMQRSS